MSDRSNTDSDPTPDTDDVELYDGTREYTAVELCRVCRLPHERLVEYLAHDVVQRAGARRHSWQIGPGERFTHVEFHRLVRAVRVRRELEVELPNLALVVDLLDRLAEQRRELERLRRQVGTLPPSRDG